MGRPLRHLQPGTNWFITTRCLEARFLLRPDDQTTSTIGLHLARACTRFSTVQRQALEGQIAIQARDFVALYLALQGSSA